MRRAPRTAARALHLAVVGVAASCSLIVDPPRFDARGDAGRDAIADAGRDAINDVGNDGTAACAAAPTATLAAGCPTPTIALEGARALAAGCAPAALDFAWALLRPDGKPLLSLSGRGDATAAGADVTGGTYAAPRLALRADPLNIAGHVTLTAATSPQFVFQEDFPLSPRTAYTLRFVARSQPALRFDRIVVGRSRGDAGEFGLDSGSVPLSGELQAFSMPFTTNDLSDGTPTTATRLRFELQGKAGAEYWLDDVELIERASGKNVLRSSTFDDLSAWRSYFDASSGSFGQGTLAATVGGLYMVQLRITPASGGGVPSEGQTTVELPACP